MREPFNAGAFNKLFKLVRTLTEPNELFGGDPEEIEYLPEPASSWSVGNLRFTIEQEVEEIIELR